MQDSDNGRVQDWVEKSDRALSDAKNNIDNGQLENAQNRLYYAMFYVIKALSRKFDFATAKHSQLLGWFNKNYVNTAIVENEVAAIYKDTFINRQECDYGCVYRPTKEQLTRDFGEAEVFIAEVKKLLAAE